MGVLVRFGRGYALVKQVTREGPLEVWVRMVRPSEAISGTSIPWSGPLYSRPFFNGG